MKNALKGINQRFKDYCLWKITQQLTNQKNYYAPMILGYLA